MPQLLVRGVDLAVVLKLKARARRNGRSLEGELRAILTQASGADLAQALQELARIQAAFSGREFPDSAELVLEDRER